MLFVMASGMSPEALELRRARERMRYVNPENCAKITAHGRYWTRQFLARYIDRCESVARERPDEGYALARALPLLVDRIPVRPDDVRHFRSPKEKAIHELLAQAVLGSACSLIGEPEEAELAFRRAAVHLSGPAWAAAEFRLRYGAHLARIGDPSADRHFAEALELWDEAGDATGRARAHFARGALLELPGSERILEIARAIRLADGATKKGRGVRDRAIEYLCRMDLVFAGGLKQQSEAVSLIAAVQADFKGRAMDSPKARLVWIEGVLVGNLGVDRHSERLLKKARQVLRELEKPVDFVLVTLDLARLLMGYGELEAAQSLRAKTLVALEDLQAKAPGSLTERVGGWGNEADSAALTDIRHELADKSSLAPA